MNKYILTAACGLAFSAAFAQTKALPDNPNILLILVDDLGYGDLSCQGAAKDIQTPHIDKLLNEGVRFTNFHANCPVSSPSRASLLTGRYPDMVGVPGVIRTHKEDSWGYLSEDAVLLPQMLKKRGYHNAMVGKWNLGLESPNTPTERGFDFYRGFLGDMMDDYYTHRRFVNNYMRENLKEIDPQGHATEIFSDWAIRYLSDMKQKQEPFFLYLAYNAPHTPIQPPQEWLEKVKKREPSLPEKRAKIVALIEHLDYNVGRVYEALEQNGQLENTIIIFTSDNGGQDDAGANNGPFRGAKQDMYEGGIRVAGGIYWKNQIRPAVRDNFVMLSDMFPTLCDLTAVPVSHEIDGISILPLLRGEEQDTGDRMVYWVRREGNSRYGGQAYYASQYRDFKILQNTPWEPIQFFNIKEDPKEQSPIGERSSDTYKNLFNGLMEHIRQTSHHLRLVIVGSVVEIVNDLLRQRVEGTGSIQFLHGVDDDVAGNNLIFFTLIKIFTKALLIEGKQVHPENLLSLKLRIGLDILYHKADQIQEILRADQKVHTHHHIEMADQLSRIIVFALKPEEMYQFLSGLILNLQRLFQLFLIKSFTELIFQFPDKILKLSGQVLHRGLIVPVGNIQESERHTLLLLQVPEGIEVTVTG